MLTVFHIHKKVSEFNYEDIEGFLIPDQLFALEKYLKDKKNILEIGFNLGIQLKPLLKILMHILHH